VTDHPEILPDVVTPDGVEVVRLEPGDVLVFHHPSILSREAVGRIRAEFKALFPHNALLVLDEGARLDVIRPDGRG
jgi:hypothetical protein